MTPQPLIGRRTLLAKSIELAVVAALPAIRGRAALAQSAVPATGTHLVLLGTQGGPNFNTERAESANAIVVDGHIYIVDLGEGGLLALRRLNLNYRAIGRVFLTHLHDDHTSDVASLLTHQWTDGRVEPTVVAGPRGTRRFVAAALDLAAANAAIRLVDEARSVEPRDLFRGEDLAATSEPREVYRDERVTVTTIENTHFPPESKRRIPYRSLSYRFDTATRSIVISGDTAYSPGLVRLARGADVLVCEAMDVESMRRAFDERVRNGAYADNPEGIWKHIVETHTPTVDAGRMAAEAAVGTLVLSHLVPGALAPLPDETYVRGVRERYAGRVVVGRDLLVL